MSESKGWLTRTRVLIGAGVAVCGLAGYLLDGGRTVIRVIDAPDGVDAMRDSLRTLGSTLDDARLRICEYHQLFPSQCPAWGRDDHEDEEETDAGR